MRIKNIEFVLENCEQIEIDGKCIGEFIIKDIEMSIERIACNWVDELTIAKTIVIEIHKDANKNYNPFGLQDKTSKVFDRLTEWSDITHVNFALEDQYAENYNDEMPLAEKYYSFAVDYNEDNPGSLCAENINQSHYVSKCGNLYLVISKDKKIKDFFDKDDLDDEDYTNFRFDMMDINSEEGE